MTKKILLQKTNKQGTMGTELVYFASSGPQEKWPFESIGEGYPPAVRLPLP